MGGKQITTSSGTITDIRSNVVNVALKDGSVAAKTLGVENSAGNPLFLWDLILFRVVSDVGWRCSSLYPSDNGGFRKQVHL